MAMVGKRRFVFGIVLALTAWIRADDATPATTRPVAGPPPFRVDHAAPLEPAERLVAEEKNFRQYRVEFNGIERDRVPAFVYTPIDESPKHPAVLLQFGSGGNKSTNYIVALGRQFVARGFVVLTIDVPGRGERRNFDAQTKAWGPFGRPGMVPHTLGDYSRAIDYLSARPDVDPERIGYAGISLGAITGVTFVAHEPRVHAMASIVGGGNFLGMLKVAWDPETKKIAERVDPFYHVALIAPRPLLLLNATHDQLVPRFFSESLHKAAGPSAKKVWIDTDHFFQGIDRYAVLAQVIDFMQDSLKVAPPADAKKAAQ